MKLKKSGIITKSVVIIMIVYAVLSLISVRNKIEAARAEENILAERVKTIEASNAAIEYEISHSTDAETIESIAREKLGLVLPGETIYYDISD